MDIPPTATVRGQLIALHDMLVRKINNNENDAARLILREISSVSQKYQVQIPEAPSTYPKNRIVYWNELFERARRIHPERSIELLREMRKEIEVDSSV